MAATPRLKAEQGRLCLIATRGPDRQPKAITGQRVGWVGSRQGKGLEWHTGRPLTPKWGGAGSIHRPTTILYGFCKSSGQGKERIMDKYKRFEYRLKRLEACVRADAESIGRIDDWINEREEREAKTMNFNTGEPSGPFYPRCGADDSGDHDCPHDRCKPSIDQEIAKGLIQGHGEVWYVMEHPTLPCTQIILPMDKWHKAWDIGLLGETLCEFEGIPATYWGGEEIKYLTD